VRVALIRGPNLNPWELGNFELDAEVVAFGSRRGSFESHGLPLERRRLASPADAIGALPGLAQGLIYRLAGNLEYLAGLEKALKGFDIAHSAELVTMYSRQAVRAREKGYCRRVVATVWENIALPPPENGLVARRSAEVAAGLDAAIAITEKARLGLELAGIPTERIEVIPMGVDVSHFSPREDAPGAHGPLRILSVARLVTEKGVEDLVLALRLLAARGVDARLTLVGSGPLAGRLESLARRLDVSERLTLRGPLPYAELPEVYRAHDVFVLASAPRATWREQFGFAVVEAMACGLPVIAGNSGSLDEVVGDPDQLVVPHDPTSLASGLEELATDPALRLERGRRNRAWATERYDRLAVRERISGFYERVLARPARSG
jgi:glycosyltransferase involved in cell wall biosynthesis